MGLFAKILTKLGIKKPEPVSTPASVAAAAPKPVATTTAAKPVAPTPVATAAVAKATVAPVISAPKVQPAPIPTPISEVDVVTKLEGLAKANPAKLDWKVSIVDLLKLLDLDSSFEARKEMAVELGCPAELMKDSAKMNIWLHKTVLKEIAQNGGNIPKDLLD